MAQGHNNPPNPIDEALAPFGDYITEAEGWLDGEDVTTEEQMKSVDALLKQIKAADKAVKGAEESAAKPIYDQWKSEKAKFAPTLKDLDALKKGLASIVGGFKKKLAAEKKAIKRKAYEEAERLRREAEIAEREAADGDIEAQREAQAKKQAATDAKKDASEANRDKVTGLRTVTKFETKDHRAALHWIAQNDKAAMTSFIDEYVRRNHKAASIDGVEVWTEKEGY